MKRNDAVDTNELSLCTTGDSTNEMLFGLPEHMVIWAFRACKKRIRPSTSCRRRSFLIATEDIEITE